MTSVGTISEPSTTPAQVSAHEARRAEHPRIVVRGPGPTVASDLDGRAAELGVPPIVVQLLALREVEDDAQQRDYLQPRLAMLRPPHAMAGFDAALELLQHAVAGRWRVGVFGDYDVDGVTTATLLTTYLEALGLEVVCRVAHRERGYGFTVADADAFADAGCRLVLLGDVGTSDVEALGRLQERRVPSTVIDHHQVPERRPPTDAFINPHQDGCGFPFKGLCSAGVAFYLCAALRTRLVRTQTTAPDPRHWLDLVAVATICDMMPLRAENRVLTAAGLQHIARRSRPGLRSLLEQAGVAGDEPLDEGHVGFKIGPRLNAPGRLGAADPALRLLRARTLAEARAHAQQVEALNARRRQLSDETVAQAQELLATDPDVRERAGLVVAHSTWLPGIVGIAAARLVEQFGRPALVLAVDEERGLARGSARSVPGIDVRAALERCAPLLERFGGHREAAGVSLRSTHIPELAEAFAAALAEQFANVPGDGERVVVDGPLALAAVDESLCSALRRLAPFGVGFAEPRFVGEACRVERVRVLKHRHLALTLAQDRVRHEAIAFGQAFHDLRAGETIGCVFTPGLERFRGLARLRLQVHQLWRW